MQNRIQVMEIQFWRHFSKSTNTIFSLYVRIKYNHERAELGSTGVRIPTVDWDAKSKRVLPTHRQHESINRQLDALTDRLEIAYSALLRGGRTITAQEIVTMYKMLFESETPKAKEVPKTKLTEALQAWVNSREELYENGELRYSTLKKNREAQTKLLQYLTIKEKKSLAVDDFNLRAINLYRTWLEDQKFGYPHINKLMKTVRQAVKWAYEHEICDDNPLEGLRLKREKLKAPTFLHVDQVTNLQAVPFRTEVLQKVADLFVIYCRTGFHYADLKKVIQESKDKIGKGIAGIDWIRHERIKTGVMAKVPVFEEILPVIEKYGGWDKLPLISNQKMNEYLKVIAAERNLPANLSVKMGRNSLADWLLNEKGWSKEAVKVVMGLRTDAILGRYVRADERRVIFEMQRKSK